MTHGKTYNKLPRRINQKATKSKTNTGTTVLERSVEQTPGGGGGGGFKALLQLANFTLGPDANLTQKSNSSKRFLNILRLEPELKLIKRSQTPLHLDLMIIFTRKEMFLKCWISM